MRFPPTSLKVLDIRLKKMIERQPTSFSVFCTSSKQVMFDGYIIHSFIDRPMKKNS